MPVCRLKAGTAPASFGRTSHSATSSASAVVYRLIVIPPKFLVTENTRGCATPVERCALLLQRPLEIRDQGLDVGHRLGAERRHVWIVTVVDTRLAAAAAADDLRDYLHRRVLHQSIAAQRRAERRRDAVGALAVAAVAAGAAHAVVA